MANTYEIPVGSETKIVQANSKAEALASLRSNGVTPTLNTPAPVVPKSGAIAVDTLGQGNTNTALPTPTPATPTTGNLGMANNSTIGGIKADASYTPPVNTEKEQAKSALSGLISKITGQADEVNQIRDDAQIYEKKQKATAISNELDQLDKSFRDEVSVIRENKFGKFGGAVEQDVAKAQDRYENRRANISLAYKVAYGDYQGAEEIVTNKINALKDQNTQALNAYQLYADYINNDLTESEKLQVQEQINLRQKKAETIENVYANILSQAIQNKAPASILSAIDDASRAPGATAATIAAAAGQYGVDKAAELDLKYKQAQIDNIYSDNARSSGPESGPGGNNGEYSSDLDAMVGTVLSTIPSKFGQETFRNEMGKARNDTDKINILAAQVLKGQPAEFKNDFRNQAVGIAQIDKAIAELDKGAETGVINNTTQYTYNLLGKDFDPKLAKIQGYITSAIQPYRNSVTGAAWGDQEEGEYQSLFGSTKYSPTELRQRLVQTKELLKSKSSEGLNAFVNPLGYYDNAFDSGDLNTTDTAITANGATQSFWSNIGSWLFGNE